MLTKADPKSEKQLEAVVIKKYANRRLYNTETSSYVTLEDLAAMVRLDRDFVVYDAKSGSDLTHAVLTQIIVEQEGREGGQTLLPVPFLRQLIRFYDDAMGKMVPSYLQFSMEALTKEQVRFREQFAPLFQQNPFSAAAFEAIHQQTRKNMAIFEQALSVWQPFANGLQHGTEGQAADGSAATGDSADAGDGAGAAKAATAQNGVAKAAPTSHAANELSELKAEFAKMQAKIERLSKSRD